MPFQPPSPEETRTFLIQCAARAASIKGLAGSEWYLEEEIIGYLKLNHPETFSLFIRFAEAYKVWSDYSWVHRHAMGEDKLDPASNMELIDFMKRIDAARELILTHLGLKK